MTFVEMVSWIATIFTILAVWNLGSSRTRVWGWNLGMIGCFVWLYYAGITSQVALGVVNLVLLFTHLRGFLNDYTWRAP